jgi:hypothetical protein
MSSGHARLEPLGGRSRPSASGPPIPTSPARCPCAMMPRRAQSHLSAAAAALLCSAQIATCQHAGRGRACLNYQRREATCSLGVFGSIAVRTTPPTEWPAGLLKKSRHEMTLRTEQAIRVLVIGLNLAWLAANLVLMAKLSSRPMPWDYWFLRAVSIFIPLSSAIVIAWMPRTTAIRHQTETLPGFSN